MQNKISGWLKVLTIVIGIAGALFFAAVTGFVLCYENRFFLRPAAYIYVGLLWYTYILCLLILYRFWKVCGEIGNENSFSEENAESFQKMAVYAVFICGGYIAGMAAALVTGSVTPVFLLFCLTAVFVSLSFCVVCRCLSVLIYNACEIKQENDLTI